MSFPRYPNYKDSGVDWLEEMPVHWEVWKLSHAFEIIGSGTTPSSDHRSYYDDGDIAWLNTGDLNDGDVFDCEKRITAYALEKHSSLKVYPPGSLAIAMYGATIGKLGMLHFSATVNQACCIFSGKSHIAPGFLFYWLLGFRKQIVSMATGGGQPNISQEILRNLRAACPAPSEQASISEFLDRETAKINDLMSEQERLITLLKEKRQAVIAHAVTKGLDPTVPMKDSGVEWLGEVPAHWQVQRMANLFTEVVESGDDSLPVLSVSIHSGVSDKELNDSELDRKVTRSDDRGKYKKVQRGDLVYNMMRAWQGGFGSVTVQGQVSPAYVVARPIADFFTAFVEQALRTPQAVEEMRRHSQGVTDFRLRLYWQQFKCIQVALPAKEEQEAILAFIAAVNGKLEVLEVEAQQAIDLLKERRTALISAAVTGQIDVRGLVKEEQEQAA